MTRLLIECTYVYEHPDLNSGIQRVVRNVIQELKSANTVIECIPVIMQGGQLKRVISLLPPPTRAGISFLRQCVHRLDHLRLRLWGGHAYISKRLPWHGNKALNMPLLILWKLLSLNITLPLRAALWLDRRDEASKQRSVPLDIECGDIFLLLDSSWHLNFYSLAERLKEQGASIISVVYDLIPISHPQFCDAGLTKVFERWFDWIATTADGFVCISQTVQGDVQRAVTERLGADVANKRKFEYFHLGSELDLVQRDTVVDPRIKVLFDATEDTYLMVSTIEPRKNHIYLIKTFDTLWAKGSKARLCIIGKIGWKSDELIGLIQRHPELNKRLFMFNQLNDAGLEYAYAHSSALLFPSHAEGFGLPLVEAMQRGVPVMASDLPVFREIGGEYVAYFDLSCAGSLAALILEHQNSGRFPAGRSLDSWEWINWRTASLQLLEKTLKIAGQTDLLNAHYASYRSRL
ncbi:MAG: glycosyl transferase [Pseudomonadales bacterium RIFCSPLOWO2_12_59_9]|nr:MAG: glycosyl transferase [Pseudomonadales bacterium RIFCSPLOWO2_12_59_9]